MTDQLLLGWLYSSISIDIATQLINCSTSQELWQTTEEMADAATRAKEMWLKGELQRTRKGSMKMEEYLAKMKSLSDNLQLATCRMSYILKRFICPSHVRIRFRLYSYSYSVDLYE